MIWSSSCRRRSTAAAAGSPTWLRARARSRRASTPHSTHCARKSPGADWVTSCDHRSPDRPGDPERPPDPGRGRRLGVDVGTVRIGVAASDPDAILATPVETVQRDRRKTRTDICAGWPHWSPSTRRSRSSSGSRGPWPIARGHRRRTPLRTGRPARRADRPGAGPARRRTADHGDGPAFAARGRGTLPRPARRDRSGGRGRDTAGLARSAAGTAAAVPHARRDGCHGGRRWLRTRRTVFDGDAGERARAGGGGSAAAPDGPHRARPRRAQSPAPAHRRPAVARPAGGRHRGGGAARLQAVGRPVRIADRLHRSGRSRCADSGARGGLDHRDRADPGRRACGRQRSAVRVGGTGELGDRGDSARFLQAAHRDTRPRRPSRGSPIRRTGSAS